MGQRLPHHEPDIVEMSGDDERLALSAELGYHSALARHRIGKAQLLYHRYCETLYFLILSRRAVNGNKLFECFKAVFLIKAVHKKSRSFRPEFFIMLSHCGKKVNIFLAAHLVVR